jgi:hypothetical protein
MKIKSNLGIPHGSILSSLIYNIVLNRLDEYIINILQPKYTKGIKRRLNRYYTRLEYLRKMNQLGEYRFNPEVRRKALLDIRTKSKLDIVDPNYRRILFIRYVNDFVLLFSGPLKEAQQIKTLITEFLFKNCGLELKDNQTTITNTRQGFQFLGAQLKRRTNVSIFNNFKNEAGSKITRRSTLRLAVDVSIPNLVNKLVDNAFARRNHIGTLLAKGKTSIIHLSHQEIIWYFNSKISRILSAFSFAGNYSKMNGVI